MKVVINRCFGGFGISNEAFEKLLERKGIAFTKVPATYPIRENKFDYYRANGDLNEESYLSELDFYDDRADPDLITIVEELGEKANGWAAELAIVEVPDEVKWHIHEDTFGYDGIESVHEDHRVWS